jgi:hypothetical protein
LQHGSLLWQKSPFAPELAGWRDLTGIDVPLATLIDSLTVHLQSALDMRIDRKQFPTTLESKLILLTNTKYALPEWTNRR